MADVVTDASGSGVLHCTRQFDAHTVRLPFSLDQVRYACHKTFYSKLADEDCQSESILGLLNALDIYLKPVNHRFAMAFHLGAWC